jgi:hypothetical protein
MKRGVGMVIKNQFHFASENVETLRKLFNLPETKR